MTDAQKQKRSLFRRITVPPLVFPRPASAIEEDRKEYVKKEKQNYYIKSSDGAVKSK